MINALRSAEMTTISENTKLYAEIYACSYETGLLRGFLSDLYRELFIDTAEYDGIIKREQIVGGVRPTLTTEQRRQLLKDRLTLKCKCINRSNLSEIFRKLGCSAYVYKDNLVDFKMEINIYDYHTPEESMIIEKQILGLFPVGYDISFVYG